MAESGTVTSIGERSDEAGACAQCQERPIGQLHEQQCREADVDQVGRDGDVAEDQIGSAGDLGADEHE